MRFVIQRVSHASVKVNQNIAGSIDNGYMVLIGIRNSDTRETADKMIQKMINLRIFEDGNGKTNRNISSVNGSLLLIPQFTLYADCHHGNRPSFTGAGDPQFAEQLYQYIIDQCRKSDSIHDVQTGIFGADMKVELLNDGPFTIILDSDELGY